MRKFHIFLILFALVIASPAQTRKTTSSKKTQTTSQKKATSQKKTTSRKKTSSKKTSKKSSADDVATPSIKGLKNEREQIKKQIAAQKQKLRNNERDVKKRLQNLMVINTEIADKRKTIDTIRRDINILDGNIGVLGDQLVQLEKELNDRKTKFVKSMRYMHRNRSVQNQLMFIFSAKNFSQMYRRMRFMREYASYQRVQGEMVKAKQAELTKKQQELASAKKEKNTLLYKGEQERRTLESKQEEQQSVVTSLQKEQKTIKGIIDKQMQRDKALNAEIDRLVAIEVEKARQRAIAEAKRKAEAARKAAEAERKRKEEELARKKAAAEAAARENARRIALAKEREERLKREAEAASKKTEEERKLAEDAAREAKRVREETERRAAEDERRHEREVAEAKKAKEEAPKMTMASEDLRISGSFESNRGRLPMPVAGNYRIVSHFGQYNVDGLKNVRLDNKGINILGSPGAVVRSIYDGEVSAVFSLGGTTGVMVRHGSYISVYCNLGSVSVRKGQKVSTRQALGTVGRDNILQFQLRRERSKLNPESWLGR
ncbi:peptidoglycan DD-metalloendopeptidase family protein [Prevotella sp. P2-180]|uniref:peptidoglycan DD-metalloendopeptidase family protein n=1 Tax=Prevotella sp. P2-180 TaxID=2024224 RepID=UPI000B965E0A|nr:peptidoglycan DD-metalloendopeptidase family protein [Prevotella sp. P2-180]MCI7257503.1 peptidoglycan DD-metalloendopeptidase family protein [Prevotella sp.]OYP67761.1 peptidase M23 [Prevotella sp. P2-180]